MITALFAIVIACTPAPTPTKIAVEPAVIAPAPPPPSPPSVFTKEETREMAAKLQTSFEPMAARIAQNDPELGKIVNGMFAKVDQAPLATMDSSRPVMFEKEACEEPCAMRLAFITTQQMGPTYAAWAHELHVLLINARLVDSPVAAAIVLHEVRHSEQDAAVMPFIRQQDFVANGAVPMETDAHNFSRRLYDAYTDGAWSRGIDAVTNKVLRGSPTIKVGLMTFAPYPAELYAPFGKDGNPPTRSAVEALTFQAHYDLNRALIERTMKDPQARQAALDGVYANIVLEQGHDLVMALHNHEFAKYH